MSCAQRDEKAAETRLERLSDIRERPREAASREKTPSPVIPSVGVSELRIAGVAAPGSATCRGATRACAGGCRARK